jgi:hypothetical protein
MQYNGYVWQESVNTERTGDVYALNPYYESARLLFRPGHRLMLLEFSVSSRICRVIFRLSYGRFLSNSFRINDSLIIVPFDTTRA